MPIVRHDFFFTCSYSKQLKYKTRQYPVVVRPELHTAHPIQSLLRAPVHKCRPPFPAVRTVTLLSNYWTKVNEHLPSWRALVIIFMLAARVFLMEPQLEKLK
jgi:hypothetical protein